MGAIRFIHTADLHLGSPFTGMKGLQKEQWKRLKDSTLDAFDRLIAYAAEEQPDFVLIVGDIYDGEDRSIRAQHRFQTGMQKLYECGIPVVISHGNHDHLSGSWTRFELPENVHVFDENVSQFRLETKNGIAVITGFSYGQRHIKEAVISRYPAAEEKEHYHIGMLHGSMDGDTAHAVYAPFTKEQLLDKNYDYWALGHIHMRQELHRDPYIVYPGNLQGRHRNESGQKGFYDITLSKQETILSFVPASVIQFERIPVNCEGLMHMNELLDACREAVSSYLAECGPVIAEIQFTHIDGEAAELFDGMPEEELLETIRESVEGSAKFVWIRALGFEERASFFDMSPLGEKIIGVMEEWNLSGWKSVLKDVYRHPKGSRFLEALNQEETEEIREAAVHKIRRGMKVEE